MDDALLIAENSPTRQIDWRWKLANYCADVGLPTSVIRDRWLDVAIAEVFERKSTEERRSAGDWLQSSMRRMGRQPATVDEADREAFGEAARLLQDDGLVRWAIEAMLAAGVSIETIAQRFELDPLVVAAFEAVFWNVSDLPRTCDLLRIQIRRRLRTISDFAGIHPGHVWLHYAAGAPGLTLSLIDAFPSLFGVSIAEAPRTLPERWPSPYDVARCHVALESHKVTNSQYIAIELLRRKLAQSTSAPPSVSLLGLPSAPANATSHPTIDPTEDSPCPGNAESERRNFTTREPSSLANNECERTSAVA